MEGFLWTCVLISCPIHLALSSHFFISLSDMGTGIDSEFRFIDPTPTVERRRTDRSIMRKNLYEIDLKNAPGYPGRYLEHFSKLRSCNSLRFGPRDRESIVEAGLSS